MLSLLHIETFLQLSLLMWNQQQAMNDPRWKKAMEEEIATLEANDTWTIEDLPLDKTAIGCM